MNNKLITYRKLTKNDESELRKIVDIVHATLEDDEFFFKYTDEEYNYMWTRDFVIGAFHSNDGLIGFNLLVIYKDFCDLDGVMVLPKYRNEGIAMEMNNLLIQHAKKIGAKKIIVKIHPNNKASIGFPSKMGFKPRNKNAEITPEGHLRKIFELNIQNIK